MPLPPILAAVVRLKAALVVAYLYPAYLAWAVAGGKSPSVIVYFFSIGWALQCVFGLAVRGFILREIVNPRCGPNREGLVLRLDQAVLCINILLAVAVSAWVMSTLRGDHGSPRSTTSKIVPTSSSIYGVFLFSLPVFVLKHLQMTYFSRRRNLRLLAEVTDCIWLAAGVLLISVWVQNVLLDFVALQREGPLDVRH